MTLEEFMQGVSLYRDYATSLSDPKLYKWVEFLCRPENNDIFELVVFGAWGGHSEEEIKTAWHVKNSPLGKALT